MKSSAMNFNAGDRFTIKGVTYEIASVSHTTVRYMNTRGGRIAERGLMEFIKYISDAAVKIEPSVKPEYQVGGPVLSDDAENVMWKRLDYIENVLSRTENYSSKAPNGPRLIIKETAEKRGEDAPGHSTVCRWIKSYIESNRNPFSQAPLMYRKPKRGGFSDLIETKVAEFCDKSYAVSERHTVLCLAYALRDEIEQLIYSNRVYQDEKVPSIRTLQRRISEVDPYKVLQQHHGKHNASRRVTAAGKSPDKVGFLECVEADGTLLDIHLVDPESGGVIGRPYLTVIIDRYSRHILSYELSYLPFCSHTLLIALKGAVNDVNGLPGGKIAKIVFDNGSDYTSQSVKNFCSGVGISIEYAPPYSPNAKPYVERFFRTLNEQLIHRLPGTSFSNPTQRGSYPSELRAGLTIEDLRSVIASYLQQYHHALHSVMNKTPAEVVERELMRDKPHYFDPVDVDRMARLVKKVKINNGRVRFNGIYWFSHALKTTELKLKTQHLNEKVEIYIDPTDLSAVLVRDPFDKTSLITAENTKLSIYDGLSLYELKRMESDNGKSVHQMSDPEFHSARLALIEKFRSSNTKTIRKQKARVSASKKNPSDVDRAKSSELEAMNDKTQIKHAFSEQALVSASESKRIMEYMQEKQVASLDEMDVMILGEP